MMTIFHHLVAFVIALGVLIIVHEYGHYLAARWIGVKVLRFSIGLGRPICSKKFGHDGTEWVVGIVPLGGYVKMLDEQESEVSPEERHRSFNRQSVWQRMVIVVAGPLANLLLAVFVYWGMFCYGVDEFKPILGSAVVDSPASAAGIENGDQVLKVGGKQVETWQEMRWVLLRQIVDQDFIELEVVNPHNQSRVRILDVSSSRAAGFDGDVLEKLGLGFYRPRIAPIIGRVDPGGVAAKAGLRPGDEFLSINQSVVATWSDVVQIVRNSPEKLLDIEFKRDGVRAAVKIVPVEQYENGRAVGRIGIAVKAAGQDLMVTIRYGVVSSLAMALNETWDKSVFTLTMIGKMLAGDISWRNVSGPLMIADYAGQSAMLGPAYYLKFLALVSISLAVFNLLPIPILDGGHLLYYVAEVIRRKPLSERVMAAGQRIGMAFLLLLTAFAFFNDINRLISG